VGGALVEGEAGEAQLARWKSSEAIALHRAGIGEPDLVEDLAERGEALLVAPRS